MANNVSVVLTSEDLKQLVEIENYLFNINIGALKSDKDDNFAVFSVKEMKDPKAYEMFLKLYLINEKLQSKETGGEK